MSLRGDDACSELFERVRRTFPGLRMDLHAEHPDVDRLLDVPEQPGLDFAVSVNLQGDELHLSAGAFWVPWFPCTDAAVREGFIDAVVGLLSGRYRILEHYRGRWPVKAELQRPDSSGWQTLATWSGLGSWVPGRRHTRILQNREVDK